MTAILGEKLAYCGLQGRKRRFELRRNQLKGLMFDIQLLVSPEKGKIQINTVVNKCV